MEKLPCNIGNMTKLIDALESGAYSQSRHVLRDNVGYCCAGVACDVAGPDIGGSWRQRSEEGYWTFTAPAAGTPSFDETRDMSLPPYSVAKWLGIPSGRLPFAEGAVAPDAAGVSPSDGVNFNDSFDGTFRDIAAALRASYLPDEA